MPEQNILPAANCLLAELPSQLTICVRFLESHIQYIFITGYGLGFCHGSVFLRSLSISSFSMSSVMMIW